MSDIDKWRQRALRLEALLDDWGICSQPVAEMSVDDIKQAMYAKVGGRAPLPKAEPPVPLKPVDDDS